MADKLLTNRRLDDRPGGLFLRVVILELANVFNLLGVIV